MTERRKPVHDDPDALGAEDLARLEPDEERALATALAAAFDPASIDAARHERILRAALEDPLAPPTEEELAESERLRCALEGDGAHPDAILAQALRAASRPPDANVVDRAVERALEASTERSSGSGSGRRSNVVFVVFGGAGAALALAAAIALLVAPAGERAPNALAPAAEVAASVELARSRSTASLFEQHDFQAATSARVDRISQVRMRELRQNRYALWGVK